MTEKLHSICSACIKYALRDSHVHRHVILLQGKGKRFFSLPQQNGYKKQK